MARLGVNDAASVAEVDMPPGVFLVFAHHSRLRPEQPTAFARLVRDPYIDLLSSQIFADIDDFPGGFDVEQLVQQIFCFHGVFNSRKNSVEQIRTMDPLHQKHQKLKIQTNISPELNFQHIVFYPPPIAGNTASVSPSSRW